MKGKEVIENIDDLYGRKSRFDLFKAQDFGLEELMNAGNIADGGGVDLGAKLFHAVRCWQDEEVTYLIEQGAPVNYQDPGTGLTSLHLAASFSSRSLIRILSTAQDLDHLMRDRKGRLAWEVSVHRQGDPVVTRFLASKCARQAELQNRLGELHKPEVKR